MIAKQTFKPAPTPPKSGLAQARARLSSSRLVENRGRVTQMIGLVI
mgnify:FL=1